MGAPVLSGGSWDCGSAGGEWSPGACGCNTGEPCSCGGSCGCTGEGGGSCGGAGKPPGEVPLLPDYDGEIWASSTRASDRSVWDGKPSERPVASGVSVSDLVQEVLFTIGSQSKLPEEYEIPVPIARLAETIAMVAGQGAAPPAWVSHEQANYVREVVRYVRNIPSAVGGILARLQSSTPEDLPLKLWCWRDAGTHAECFLDWDCTKWSDTHWWGILVCVCNIFAHRDCPCKCWEIGWVDMIIIGAAIYVLKNPRIVKDILRWLLGTGTSPVPVPIG